jgi:hypothetical protein
VLTIGPTQLLGPQPQQREQGRRRAEGVGKRTSAVERLRRDHVTTELGDDEPAPRERPPFEQGELFEGRIVVDRAEPQHERRNACPRRCARDAIRARAARQFREVPRVLRQELFMKRRVIHDRSPFSSL